MLKNLFKRKPKTVDPSKYIGAIESQLEKGGKDLQERQDRFENFQSFVRESVEWFKEIQNRRFKGDKLSPLEKSMVMKYETMASQYITDMYKMFNLVTKTTNYHETIQKKTVQSQEKKTRQKQT